MARLPDHLKEPLQTLVNQLDDAQLDDLEVLILERRQQIRVVWGRTPTQDIDMGELPSPATRS